MPVLVIDPPEIGMLRRALNARNRERILNRRNGFPSYFCELSLGPDTSPRSPRTAVRAGCRRPCQPHPLPIIHPHPRMINLGFSLSLSDDITARGAAKPQTARLLLGRFQTFQLISLPRWPRSQRQAPLVTRARCAAAWTTASTNFSLFDDALAEHMLMARKVKPRFLLAIRHCIP